MAATPKFDDLARQFVLADENEGDQREAIAEQAAQAIEASTNKRVTVGQWVASVYQWMQSTGDDDLISRARALDFLANTLQVIRRKDDTFNADQIKLLVTFFSSLFDSDHKAGVTASAKALRHLIVMKNFQPSLGKDIIESICKLGGDFKLQTPATRLELYNLFSSLLENPAVVYDLEYRHSNTSRFILDLLTLCQNERDPQNLMMWFAILKSFLQDFSPSTDVALEVFKAFSAYFPISLRASATPSGITADNLKVAVRACFSAHHRIASFTIPYLINKLDQGDAVTVAVKVDVLFTLDACLTKYDDPEQSVVPYSDQIWGSLKYEVRNGEIPDIIKATLKVLGSLTKRLEGKALQSFLSNAWRDLSEDVSDFKYTAQAGRLLVAIAGATVQSFAMLIPRAVEHIKATIKHTTSALHKRHLITLLSSILNLRLHLIDGLEPELSQSEDTIDLSDDLFGDALFHDLYLPFWQEHSTPSAPIEYIGIQRETMRGLGALVGQKSSGKAPAQRLCSDSTCETIFGLFARPVIICPLEGIKYFNATDGIVPQELLDAAKEVLRNAVPLYPPSFRYILLQYLSSIKTAYQLQPRPDGLALQIRNVSATLCAIVHPDTLEQKACWLNETFLINTFLQGLQWMLSKRADPTFWIVFIDAIHVTLKRALKQASTSDTSPKLTKEWLEDFARRINTAGVPRVDLDRPGNIEGLELEESDYYRPRRAYCLFVVQQLYRRFTTVISTDGASDDKLWTVGLGKDFDDNLPDLISRQDICLHQLGQLATSVIRVLDEEEQKVLQLDCEAFGMFHTIDVERDNSANMIPPWSLSPANEFRTAPLSLGIAQGLWPGAIRPTLHLTALNDLIAILVSTSLYCSDITRASMDTLLTVLSNKFNAKKDDALSQERLLTQQSLITKITVILARAEDPAPSNLTTLRAFRSVLHYLAGDVARLQTEAYQNTLLTLIVENSPTNIMMGRQFAHNLGLIMMPRDCLSELNHAVRKKLSTGWLYYEVVRPYFNRCFPGVGVDERQAVNRAVAIFSTLRHLNYDQYSFDVAIIVRIGIRSLTTFKVGVETESLLSVLLHILEKDPSELREHIAGLIQGLAAVYEMARNVAEAASFQPKPEHDNSSAGQDFKSKAANPKDREPIATRMYSLQFFRKLAESGYDAHLLLPHRRHLLRPLAVACGDSVREIRRTALKARQAWEALG
ncbi:hypothetical protein F5Y19DRAFT_462480 [Xylariaceae sp. FL1651]|nr:hypothetical protein F5Y19DRAFT_462480 [Xylariaceae sp. FL1651]